MATAPLLALTTITPQNAVLIDGISYFIRHTDMLTLRQDQIVLRGFTRAAALLNRDDIISEDEDRELSTVLQQVVAEVLDAPVEVKARLTDVQRLAVFMAFTPLRSRLLVPPTNGAYQAAPPSPQTSANGSRASKSTTAARRKGGSTRSRRG